MNFQASLTKPSLWAGLLLVAAIVALKLGPSDVAFNDPVVTQLRLPRVLAALVVGAGMSVTGVAMQTLLRNPLADPFILGLSSGASLGVIIALVAFPTWALSTFALSLPASIGAVLAAFAVFAIARGKGGLLPPTRLLLAGVALAAVLSSIAGFLLQIAPSELTLRASLYFSSGSLGAASTPPLLGAAGLVVAAAVWMRHRALDLDRMLLGERTAESLGVPTALLKNQLLIGSSILTGILVAVAGPIGFIGLVAPHLARILTGPGHKRLLPLAMVFGAAMLLAADTTGRCLFQPREIPAGLLTAATGGPFFLWLLRRGSYAFGGQES